MLGYNLFMMTSAPVIIVDYSDVTDEFAFAVFCWTVDSFKKSMEIKVL